MRWGHLCTSFAQRAGLCAETFMDLLRKSIEEDDNIVEEYALQEAA